jgi:DNA invertase Pin-like site-specific DNA recombinase
MIAEELREAIRVLKAQGRPLREISRALKVSRNTVRRVLREGERGKTRCASARSSQRRTASRSPTAP